MVIRTLVILVVVAALGLGLWWYEQNVRDMAEAEPVVQVVDEAPPRPRYPVPLPDPVPEPVPAEDVAEELVAPVPEPLPALDESDDPILDDLTATLDEELVRDWLVTDRIVERTVVFVNSLDGAAIPQRLRPLRHIPGMPAVADVNESPSWSPANAARYDALVTALRDSDPDHLLMLYNHYYPLFQQAYAELGDPDAYFNDRVVDIIDHLLETPEVSPDFSIERWEAHLRFADPELEEESWGRKTLMRMGPDNAALVKEWLQELRARIIEQAELAVQS